MNGNLAGDFAALLRARGWTIIRRNDNGSNLWSFGRRAEMYMPPVITLGSFEWSDITDRIAAAHDERRAEVERAVAFVRFDVTRFRVDNDGQGAQTIPLETGATVVGSAFGMLRAAATTARRPRQSIGSNYSKLGDEIVHEARLAHTEMGSFVFPVVLRVSEPDLESETEQSLPMSVVPESPERRVTRTLAQAMSALDKHVLQPAREPRMPDLLPVIIAGGTKEMFAHVSRVISEPGISWLETGFTWAPTEPAGSESPKKIIFPADSDSRELVARCVRLLSGPKNDPLRVITGPIIHISHTPGDEFGEIAIQAPTPGGSRFGRIEVFVRHEELSEIHGWMDQGTTVVVQGVVERRPGRPGRVQGIASPQPLADALSSIDPAWVRPVATGV